MSEDPHREPRAVGALCQIPCLSKAVPGSRDLGSRYPKLTPCVAPSLLAAASAAWAARESRSRRPPLRTVFRWLRLAHSLKGDLELSCVRVRLKRGRAVQHLRFVETDKGELELFEGHFFLASRGGRIVLLTLIGGPYYLCWLLRVLTELFEDAFYIYVTHIPIAARKKGVASSAST